MMTVSEEVRATARAYLPWAAMSPVLGVICFQFDGIFTGAMATKDMRNMMIVSLAIFMLAWWLLEAPLRQSRPVGGAQHLLRGARRDLRQPHAVAGEAGVRVVFHNVNQQQARG